MDHKVFKEELEEHILNNKPISSKVSEHLKECKECKNYLQKLQKLSRGLEKIKLQKKLISQDIRISLNRKQKFMMLGIPLMINKFRYIITGFVSLCLLLLGYLGYISLSDYLNNNIYLKQKIDDQYVNEVYILLETNNSNENQEVFQTIFDYYIDDQTYGSLMYPDYETHYFSLLED